jgi:hypothetical protein
MAELKPNMPGSLKRPLDLLPPPRFRDMSLSSSPAPMMEKNSSVDGHPPQSPRAEGDPNASLQQITHDPNDPCNWPQDKYERVLNCE